MSYKKNKTYNLSASASLRRDGQATTYKLPARVAFSLIEILLVLVVLSVTFMGIMSLIDRILQMENVVKNDFIAQGLAQEGVELVEAIRNANVSSSLPFYNKLHDASGALKPFTADYLAATSTYGSTHILGANATKETGNQLKFVTPTYYTLDIGAGTAFYRWFSVTYNATSTYEHASLSVDVNVYWEERGRPHQSVITTKLFNPYE